MFTLRVQNPFASHGVSCVKLPAAVAFPTDDRLLKRIEEARRVLPQNNMKPLWRSRDLECDESSLETDVAAPPPSDAATHATLQRFREARAELRSTLVRREELYPRRRAAVS